MNLTHVGKSASLGLLALALSLSITTRVAAEPAEDAAPAPRPAATRPHEGGLPPLIARLDANHDGTVSEEEFAGVAKLFKKMDRNEDGKLTPDEVRQARRHVVGRRLAEGPGPRALALRTERVERAERAERLRDEGEIRPRRARPDRDADAERGEPGLRERRRGEDRAELSGPALRPGREGAGEKAPRFCPECGRPLRGAGPLARGERGERGEDAPARRPRPE